MSLSVREIARICHEANRAYQLALGESVNPEWGDCSDDLWASVIDGVKNALDGTTPRDSHENWLRFKAIDGWTYGEVKDFEAKTHPCFLPYDELPADQKRKDELFLAIVKALSS